MLKLVVCLLVASASAYKVPVTRREMLTRAAAAVAPLAVAQNAHALAQSNLRTAAGTGPNGESAKWQTSNAGNTMLGKADFKPIMSTSGQIVAEAPVEKFVGRDNAGIDEWGSAVIGGAGSPVAPDNTAAKAAAYAGRQGAYAPRNEAAMARLMAN